MIDLSLTDEQKSVRELAHAFPEREIRPVAWEYEREATWPQAIIDRAHAIGLMNTHVPEEYGGPGLSAVDACLIEEELAWGCSGIGTTLGANGLAGAPVALAGSEEVKREYFGELVDAPTLASFLPHGTRCRFGRVGNANARGPAGRQVRDHRLEVIHHQRRLRRLVHRLI